jgi:DnaJ family protein C protein 28
MEERQDKRTNQYSGDADRPSRDWQALVDEQIAEAFRRGLFDNLPGAGKPLVIDDNPFAGDKRLAYHLLKTHNFAPPEIELDKEIRAELEEAEALAAQVRQRVDRAIARSAQLSSGEKRALKNWVERMVSEYRALLTGVNSKILTLNITAPSLMHRKTVQVERRVEELLRYVSPAIQACDGSRPDAGNDPQGTL